uniref:Uncharacterized protein n=1 Tax=Timema cristinae TaxID=61476 RepID=A0A7R9H052_TIMCR|nr:unnamed protein product [Timema cristinae]
MGALLFLVLAFAELTRGTARHGTSLGTAAEDARWLLNAPIASSFHPDSLFCRTTIVTLVIEQVTCANDSSTSYRAGRVSPRAGFKSRRGFSNKLIKNKVSKKQPRSARYLLRTLENTDTAQSRTPRSGARFIPGGSHGVLGRAPPADISLPSDYDDEEAYIPPPRFLPQTGGQTDTQEGGQRKRTGGKKVEEEELEEESETEASDDYVIPKDINIEYLEAPGETSRESAPEGRNAHSVFERSSPEHRRVIQFYAPVPGSTPDVKKIEEVPKRPDPLYVLVPLGYLEELETRVKGGVSGPQEVTATGPAAANKSLAAQQDDVEQTTIAARTKSAALEQRFAQGGT